MTNVCKVCSAVECCDALRALTAPRELRWREPGDESPARRRRSALLRGETAPRQLSWWHTSSPSGILALLVAH